MSNIVQNQDPMPITSDLGLGTYTDPANTDPSLNTSVASLNANLKGLLQLLSSTDPSQVYAGYSSQYLTTGTTTILSAPGILANFSVGDPGTTVTMQIYDSLTGSGTVLWEGVLVANMCPQLNFVAATGLTVVLSGACKVAVGYLAT